MEPNLDTTCPQPEWNDPDSIPLALLRLRDAHDEASAFEAHDQFLWAVGNGDAGTFYPVVLTVLPELERLLANGGFWTQQAVMECLIDLSGSFIPEAGYEVHDGVAVQPALQAAVRAMRTLVLPLAVGDYARARSAAELAELIDDQWQL